MSNVVIDTNVFVHSCNPNNSYFEGSVDLIRRIRDSDCIICVDEGLDYVEAKNRSRIWSEYLAHIPSMSLAKEFLAELLINERVIDVTPSVPQNILRRINRSVTDKTDRVFVKVSYNSSSSSLVSHDYAAFSPPIRQAFQRDGVANIVDCLGNLGI